MSELDREVAALQAKQAGKEELRAWLSQFQGWYKQRTVAPLNKCPYTDVVEDFTTKALEQFIGIPILLLAGPDGKLHVFDSVPSPDVRGLSWGDKRKKRRAHEELRSRGIPGYWFRFQGVGFEDTSNYGNWIFAEDSYYLVEGDVLEEGYRWPSREQFVRLCAEALHKGERLK